LLVRCTALKYVKIVESKTNTVVAVVAVPSGYDIVISTEPEKDINMQNNGNPEQIILKHIEAKRTGTTEKQREGGEHTAAEPTPAHAREEKRKEGEDSVSILDQLLGGSEDRQQKQESAPQTIDEYIRREMATVETIAKSLMEKTSQKKDLSVESIVDEILDFKPEVR